MKNEYFKKAGDLEEEKKHENTPNYFHPAGDLENHETIIKDDSELQIKNYLLEIVSGKSLDDELGNIIGGGSTIISFDELKKMVEEGCYNFIKAEYLNPEMIVVEFEKYQKIEENIITK